MYYVSIDHFFRSHGPDLLLPARFLTSRFVQPRIQIFHARIASSSRIIAKPCSEIIADPPSSPHPPAATASVIPRTATQGRSGRPRSRRRSPPSLSPCTVSKEWLGQRRRVRRRRCRHSRAMSCRRRIIPHRSNAETTLVELPPTYARATAPNAPAAATTTATTIAAAAAAKAAALPENFGVIVAATVAQDAIEAAPDARDRRRIEQRPAAAAA